jgi:2-polyprenyl-3-methyl-5-hydroxy-6-metoxy-1,4-benzoquinol methylase
MEGNGEGMTGDRSHWDNVYKNKSLTEVSWYQERAEPSLEMILSVTRDSTTTRILDVGGGASVLADNLLDVGFSDISVLDISPAALEVARNQMGPQRSSLIHWIIADVTEFSLLPSERRYDIWHDRAVFHFLTESVHRTKYKLALEHSVAPHGHVIISTFAMDGPTRCSGLEVAQYSAESLKAELGPNWMLAKAMTVTHRTPARSEQRFLYCILSRLA